MGAEAKANFRRVQLERLDAAHPFMAARFMEAAAVLAAIRLSGFGSDSGLDGMGADMDWRASGSRTGSGQLPFRMEIRAMLGRATIGAVCFYVSDIRRTATFYHDVLDLPVVNMGDDGTGTDWLQVDAGRGVDLIFFQSEGGSGKSPIIVFGLAEGGIETTVEDLSRQGAIILTPVSPAPGGWSAEFSDPDGHTLSIFQIDSLPLRLEA